MACFTLKKSATSLRAEQEAAEKLHYDYRITWYLLYCGFWAAFLHLTGGGSWWPFGRPVQPGTAGCTMRERIGCSALQATMPAWQVGCWRPAGSTATYTWGWNTEAAAVGWLDVTLDCWAGPCRVAAAGGSLRGGGACSRYCSWAHPCPSTRFLP